METEVRVWPGVGTLEAGKLIVNNQGRKIRKADSTIAGDPGGQVVLHR